MVYLRILDMVLWVGETLDESPIIGKQQWALAVAVEAAGSIDIGHVNELLEGWVAGAFISKLRKSSKRLVENDVTHFKDYNDANYEQEE